VDDEIKKQQVWFALAVCCSWWSEQVSFPQDLHLQGEADVAGQLLTCGLESDEFIGLRFSGKMVIDCSKRTIIIPHKLLSAIVSW
jgi:hypothetical protein